MRASLRVLRVLLLCIGTAAWFGIGGELLARLEDDWRIDLIKLQKRPTPAVTNSAQPRLDAVDGITYQEGVDTAWFLAPPVSMTKPASSYLHQRTVANPTGQELENYVWNSEVLANPDAGMVKTFGNFKDTDYLFAFPSYDGSRLPPFRLYPDNDYRPIPWITNHWGWMSPDMTVRKPPRTIRIGIVGDSTSHNLYAFFLQGYFNAWAKARSMNIQFEVANAGRQGFGFGDSMAALKYELGPMGMDYVVEYFAPTFSLNPTQMAVFTILPPGVKVGEPPAEQRPPPPEGLARWLSPLGPFSAIVQRELGDSLPVAGMLTEPNKPHVQLHLPPGLRGETDLQPARDYAASITSRLDKFKSIAGSINTTPFVSTERLCAWDGMKLQESSQSLIYKILNGRFFWPFSYADLRRMLDFHNATITEWARTNGVQVIDIDGRLPRDPALCGDVWHDTEAGQKMRAWLIFQALFPEITRDLRSNSVPRDNSDPTGVHPYLDKPIERIDRLKWVDRAKAATDPTGKK